MYTYTYRSLSLLMAHTGDSSSKQFFCLSVRLLAAGSGRSRMSHWLLFSSTLPSVTFRRRFRSESRASITKTDNTAPKKARLFFSSIFADVAPAPRRHGVLSPQSPTAQRPLILRPDRNSADHQTPQTTAWRTEKNARIQQTNHTSLASRAAERTRRSNGRP